MSRGLLWRIAEALLDSTQDCLDAGGFDAPDRSVIDIGEKWTAPVSIDRCASQLTVLIGTLRPQRQTATVKAPRAACGLVWEAPMQIIVLRCHPANRALPTPDEINEASRSHLEEGWQIARCLSYKWTSGSLLGSYQTEPGAEQCRFVQWGEIRTYGPEGLLRGWTVNLVVEVHDLYDHQNASV